MKIEDNNKNIKIKEALFKEFNGFKDKRIKNINKSKYFTIDDRNQKDLDANGNLYLWFCSVYLEVVNFQKFQISFTGNIPINNQILSYIKENFSNVTLNYQTEKIDNLQFEISITQSEALTILAKKIRDITKSHYSEPSFKYVCPRTANQIDKLSKIFKQYQKEFF